MFHYLTFLLEPKLVDNCPSHKMIRFPNLEMICLPPNSTGFMQPLGGFSYECLVLKYCAINLDYSKACLRFGDFQCPKTEI